MVDRAFAWMADHPWSVTALLVAAIVFVGAFERVPA